MPLTGEYEPNTLQWVRDQVALYESSGGTEGTTIRGLPVVVITNRGARSGKLRKIAVMRVEHDGCYAAVASRGGAPTHPLWYHNMIAGPHVELQDAPRKQDMVARDLPLAHVSMEYEDGGGGAVLCVDLWPGNGSAGRHDRLATVADHGVPVRLAPGVTLGG
jgi:deazaflavin-dependent oxidoreductase (nitroreductase family)